VVCVIEPSERWYLEVSGRRIGPYAWSVVVELAQARGLAATDRLWNPHLPSWMPVESFPELAELLGGAHEPAVAVESAAVAPAPIVQRGYFSPTFWLGAGMAWSLVVGAFWWQSILDWPNVVDGVLIARLRTIGGISLVAAGIVVLPALWRATRANDATGVGFVGGAARVLAAACAFILVVTTASILVNARVLLQVAFGSDPMGRGEILLLPSGTELEVRGTFNAGIASELERALHDHPGVRFVHLNSRGGWVLEGSRMADVIHSKRLGTYTATGCYSACVLAFVAGSPRILSPDARLGLHSASAEGMDPFMIEKVNDDYKATLLRHGVSKDFVSQATSAPATSIWVPSPSELVANNMVDVVSDAGMSVSGEPLTELARRAAVVEKGNGDLQRLKRTDPTKFAALDRKVRLAVRRGAGQFELRQYVAQLAAGTEGKP
jgi:GYF domain 2